MGCRSDGVSARVIVDLSLFTRELMIDRAALFLPGETAKLLGLSNYSDVSSFALSKLPTHLTAAIRRRQLAQIFRVLELVRSREQLITVAAVK